MNVSNVAVDPYNLGWYEVTSLGLDGFKIAEEINRRIEEWNGRGNMWKQYRELADSQVEEEHQLTLSYGSSCSLARAGRYWGNKERVNPAALKSLLERTFFDPTAMESVACQMDALFIGTPPIQGQATPSERALRYVQRLNQFGSSSVAGYALSAEVMGIEGIAVAKAPRPKDEAKVCPYTGAQGTSNPSFNTCQYGLQVKRASSSSTPNSSEAAGADLVHELFVGLFTTNRLRRIVPNFSYIYGGFRCPPPVLGVPEEIVDPSTGEKKTTVPVISWCRSGGDVQGNVPIVPYVLYESILPSVPFSKYVKSCSPEQFLTSFAQLLLALHIGWQQVGFTHYDLHSGNVLLREVVGVPSFWLGYEVDGVAYYIRTERVATIIDYGQVHVQVDTEAILQQKNGYGTQEREGYRISHGQIQPWLIGYQQFPDRSFPAYDSYKLLMFLHEDSRGNVGVQKVIETLLGYFLAPGTNINALHGVQFPSRYALPYDDITSQITHLELFKYLVQHYPSVSTLTRPSEPVMGCGGNEVCFTASQWDLQLGLRDEVGPSSFFEYYDFLPSLTPNYPFNNYNNAKQQHMDEINTLGEEISSLAQGTAALHLSGLNILSYQAMEAIRSSHQRLYTLTNKIEWMETLLRVGMVVASSLGDFEYHNALSQLETSLSSYRPKLCELMQSASDNYAEVCRERTRLGNQWIQGLKRDPRLKWYEESMADIVTIQYTTCCSRMLPQATKPYSTGTGMKQSLNKIWSTSNPTVPNSPSTSPSQISSSLQGQSGTTGMWGSAPARAVGGRPNTPTFTTPYPPPTRATSNTPTFRGSKLKLQEEGVQGYFTPTKVQTSVQTQNQSRTPEPWGTAQERSESPSIRTLSPPRPITSSPMNLQYQQTEESGIKPQMPQYGGSKSTTSYYLGYVEMPIKTRTMPLFSPFHS